MSLTPYEPFGLPKRQKQTQLEKILQSIYSTLSLVELDDGRGIIFGTGHFYVHYFNGVEIYVDAEGYGCMQRAGETRRNIKRPANRQAELESFMEKKLGNMSEMGLLKYAVQRLTEKEATQDELPPTAVKESDASLPVLAETSQEKVERRRTSFRCHTSQIHINFSDTTL
ncbi:hypothetical protein DSL72_006450 [Monilinia vaccinii-corymbosi]|uniref:Uncharacterized protein n=1 Tax=Monilinia vaccinii-corymbosi TaxID=61207 RepID=A0A8A3PN51_9HELO|nr:hypothetical protein DSL72_006450 [Monilinia vaccinii-corymbosi]